MSASSIKTFNKQILANLDREDHRYSQVLAHITTTTHDCYLLAKGHCNDCHHYLAKREKVFTAIGPNSNRYSHAIEFDTHAKLAKKYFAKEWLLRQAKFYSDPEYQRTPQPQLMLVPQALDAHPMCVRPHLDNHTCITCTRPHLDELSQAQQRFLQSISSHKRDHEYSTEPELDNQRPTGPIPATSHPPPQPTTTMSIDVEVNTPLKDLKNQVLAKLLIGIKEYIRKAELNDDTRDPLALYKDALTSAFNVDDTITVLAKANVEIPVHHPTVPLYSSTPPAIYHKDVLVLLDSPANSDSSSALELPPTPEIPQMMLTSISDVDPSHRDTEIPSYFSPTNSPRLPNAHRTFGFAERTDAGPSTRDSQVLPWLTTFQSDLPKAEPISEPASLSSDGSPPAQTDPTDISSANLPLKALELPKLVQDHAANEQTFPTRRSDSRLSRAQLNDRTPTFRPPFGTRPTGPDSNTTTKMFGEFGKK